MYLFHNLANPDGSAVWGVVVSTRWWLLVDHCVLRNWGRILVRAVKGLISRAGMVSICPLLWQRDVKLQQTKIFHNLENIVICSPRVSRLFIENCMLLALHRPAFYYLRVSCIRGLVTSGFCLLSGSDSHGVFLILEVLFCTIFIMLVRGDVLPVSGGMGVPFS